MASLTLTPREMEVLSAVGKYIKTDSVDWISVAKQCNFPTAKRARDRWYPIRDKLTIGGGGGSKAEEGDDDATSTPTGPSKKSTAPRKRKAVSSGDGDADDEEPMPKKCGKKKKLSSTASKMRDDDDDDDDDGADAQGRRDVKVEATDDDEFILF